MMQFIHPLSLKRIYNSRAVKNYMIKDIYNMPALEIKNLNEYKIDKSKVSQNVQNAKYH